MSVNRTKAAVIGSPVSHSRSPLLHRAGYAAIGLDWTYEAIEVLPGGVLDFLAAADDFVGLSVTMPLKTEAYAASQLHDKYAERTRAVNTLIWSESVWSGYNTDVPGLVSSIKRLAWDIDSALIIGAGATAGSALFALSELQVPNVSIMARRQEKAAELIANSSIAANALEWNPELPKTDLVIVTVPSAAADPLVVSPKSKQALDLNYHPWPSKFAGRCVANGVPIANGMILLVEQALLQFQLMTECTDLELQLVRTAMEAAATD